jgi:hypothetical protein
MVTKPSFHPYTYTQEQDLIHSLNTEVIQEKGVDCYYLPRVRNNYNQLIGEDDMSSFENAYLLEFYVDSYAGFSGDRSFMAKFGVEVREQIFFSVATKRFEEEVELPETTILRPREGDLIFFPLYKACFEIKFVDNKMSFYPSGVLPLYRMTCELFEFSNEKFSTGIEDIDSLMTHSLDIYEHGGTVNANGDVTMPNNFILNDIAPLDDSIELKTKISEIGDWSEDNPFGDIPHNE